MQKKFLFLGALCAMTGVGMGAFGAHGLKHILSPEVMAVYQTGVTYQMWHSLGLILIVLIQQQTVMSKQLNLAAWLMFVGILIFSGSLYLLAILDQKWLGAITPIGGVCFIAAWLLIAVFAAKNPTSSSGN